MPKQFIKTGVYNPCFVQTCKPASLACSIQFSFFLSARYRPQVLAIWSWETLSRKFLAYQATLSKNGRRGDKKVDRTIRSWWRALLLSTVSDKVAINWRVSHVPGSSPRRSKTIYFWKNVNDFRCLFLINSKLIDKSHVLSMFFHKK